MHSPRMSRPRAAERAPAPHPAVLRPSAGGHPLPAPVQAKMEGALGHDFANVRVHSGEEAGSIGAVAFTRGSHIHFAPGRYNPHSAAGQRLLGHELAHVVQQRAGRVALPGGPVPINADARLEAEADTAGSRAASGLAAGEAGAGAAIQRSRAPEGGVIQCGGRQSRPAEPKDDFVEKFRREQARRQAIEARVRTIHQRHLEERQAAQTANDVSAGAGAARATAAGVDLVARHQHEAHARTIRQNRVVGLGRRGIAVSRVTSPVIAASGLAEAASDVAQGNHGQAALAVASTLGSFALSRARLPLHRLVGGLAGVGAEVAKKGLQAQDARVALNAAKNRAIEERKDDHA